MQHRSGDRLRLHQQTGANFHLAPDAERVNPLIADGAAGARPHDLPVIILCAVVDRLNGMTVTIQSQQIQSSITGLYCVCFRAR